MKKNINETYARHLMEILNIAEIDKEMNKLPGWNYDLENLSKTLQFSNADEANQFVAAIQTNKDIGDDVVETTTSGASVSVLIRCQEHGGVTAKDILIAKKIEKML